MTISRRIALKLISASTRGAAAPRLALAGSVPRPLKFRVIRDGKQIGAYSVDFEQAADGTRVSTAIDLAGKIAFISASRFSHRGVERWEGDRWWS